MGINRKTEEKKMSMSKNIARLAVTAGLTAALSFGGVMAPVTMAFAAGAEGSITINQVAEDNKDNTLKAYQIFKAKVVDEEGKSKVTSDIEWSSTTIGPKVIAAIKGSAKYKKIVDADGTAALADGATAPVVAEWLAKNVTGTSASSATSSEGTRVAPGDVLYAIAAAVADETPAGNSIKVGTPWTRPDTNEDGLYGDGYYLFVSDGLKADKPNTGTSPIFAIVGGDSVTVTEKTSIPTVDKKILNDGKNKTAVEALDSDWGIVGDSQIGQEVDYKLTGTVADNIATFNAYKYEFQDTLSKGLVVTKKSDDAHAPKDLHVYIVNGNKKTEVASGFTATVGTPADPTNNSELLKVSFTDLKAVKDANGADIDVNKDSKVVVTYKAQLTGEASYAVAGNSNTVKLVYSNNPMGDGEGTSIEKAVTDHVFRLNVTKVDQNDAEKKLVAGFKVQVVENEDNASVDKWLAADGSLVADEAHAHEFMTNETTGEVKIPGLDAGKYRITETTTPESYNTIASFTITVTPSYDGQGNLTKLTVTDDSDMVDTNDVADATIPVTVKNKKGSGLPLTGLNGVTFTWIAGGAVLCIGVAHLIRSRKQAEESEQE